MAPDLGFSRQKQAKGAAIFGWLKNVCTVTNNNNDFI